MTIDNTKNEANRLQELIDWRAQRVSFWARFANQTKSNALALQRVRTRNLHAVELIKLQAQLSWGKLKNRLLSFGQSSSISASGHSYLPQARLSFGMSLKGYLMSAISYSSSKVLSFSLGTEKHFLTTKTQCWDENQTRQIHNTDLVMIVE